MKKLNKPNENVRDFLNDCIINIRDEARKRNYASIADDMESLANGYNTYGESKTLNLVGTHQSLGGVLKKELKKLYNNKLSKLGEPARVHYDKIRNSAPLDICPFCSVRVVSTVDHILPKGSYPGLSITPYNLVPSCKDCNTDKNEYVPANASQVHLHPYYDDPSEEQWLTATVTEETPIVVNYEVYRSPNLSDVFNDRIEAHFKVFNLKKLYSVYAASEVQGLGSLNDVRLEGSAEDVKTILEIMARGKRMVQKNHWDSVLYKTLADSEWFCDIGVTTIQVS